MSSTGNDADATATRDVRIVRALDEYLSRRAAGSSVDENEWLAAHPDLADELRSHLELVRNLHPGTTPPNSVDAVLSVSLVVAGWASYSMHTMKNSNGRWP